MDVTANGQLPLSSPGEENDLPSMIHNVTVFLYSYDTGRNFTITNGTATENEESLGNIMEGEEGSTVKHIDWVWPQCLAGDGEPDGADSDRGSYNVSNSEQPLKSTVIVFIFLLLLHDDTLGKKLLTDCPDIDPAELSFERGGPLHNHRRSHLRHEWYQ